MARAVTDRPASDVGRLITAGLSSLLPGLGQAINRRRRPALAFALPVLVVGLLVGIIATSTAPSVLLARLIEPSMLKVLLVLDLVLLVWRLAALAQAFLDRRYAARPGRGALVALVVLVVVTVLPHAIARTWIESAQDAFGRIFQPSAAAATNPRPALTDRINVLIVGIDKTPWRTATLTDSMMVASLDPVGRTVSLVSLPRDLVNVPLGNGSTFGPKLNSLYSYADRHAKDFPNGGMAALESAVGALLGIPIHYYAKMDFAGFVKMIDAVGGVDLTVAYGFTDPVYDGYGFKTKGYTITAGPHHMNGVEALAYARSRYATGESDFKRAERQQEVLVALRNKLLNGGSLVWRVPSLLASLGDFVTTDIPIDLLPSLAAIADEMGKGGITRVVISAPLVRPGRNQYGSIQIPNIPKIRAVAAQLFTTPGTPPTPWPTPTPGPSKATTPSASAAP